MIKPEAAYADKFKNYLIYLMRATEYTQQEIANNAGLSQTTMAFIITGIRPPSFRAACRIAKAFKEPLGNFFE